RARLFAKPGAETSIAATSTVRVAPANWLIWPLRYPGLIVQEVVNDDLAMWQEHVLECVRDRETWDAVDKLRLPFIDVNKSARRRPGQSPSDCDVVVQAMASSASISLSAQDDVVDTQRAAQSGKLGL